jgi:hypothetical protein
LKEENFQLKARWEIIQKMVDNDHYGRVDVKRKMHELETGKVGE